ncbi:MAG TPA: BON domain-containing protein [Bryobacteraceae bacterium]|jgi:hyperosmotically inducible periplasmic protein
MRTLSVLLILVLVVPLLIAQSTASDDRIYDEVRQKLAADEDINGGGLDVTVKNGVVILRGRVHNAKAKDKAEKITKKVKGVTRVDNQLKLFGED